MGELNDVQKYLIEEHVEEYQEGRIPRRELLRRVTLISGSAALAATIVAACGQPTSGVGAPASPTAAATAAATASPSPALVAQAFATPPATPATDGITVRENDPRIKVSKPEVKGTDGASLMAYMAAPAAASGKVPGIIVIHENRGQTEHIRDVVRRAATAGFVAVTIDLVARAGGAAKLTDQAAFNAELGKLTLAGKLADHKATIAYLKTQSSGAIGVVGFCFGGGEVWNLVAAGADLKAAVPFYGPQPSNFADISKTKTAVSAVYAQQDTRITGTATQMEETLKKAGVPTAITVYPGANHGFHNDTGGDRYNAVQAQRAWVATVEWFRKYLV